MPWKRIKQLAVKVGTYEKDGETKNRYLNIGYMLKDSEGDGFMITIDRTFNPAGVVNPEDRDTVVVSLFDIQKREEPRREKPVAKKQEEIEDDIPF